MTGDSLHGRYSRNLKLPHVRVNGAFNLETGSVPTFAIDWYRKAMQGGMILNKATIFGMKNGRLLGGGEAGSEVVAGAGSLMEMIRQAVFSAMERMLSAVTGAFVPALDGIISAMQSAFTTVMGDMLSGIDATFSAMSARMQKVSVENQMMAMEQTRRAMSSMSGAMSQMAERISNVTNNTTNKATYGDIHINVYEAQGQDTRELVDVIE